MSVAALSAQQDKAIVPSIIRADQAADIINQTSPSGVPSMPSGNGKTSEWGAASKFRKRGTEIENRGQSTNLDRLAIVDVDVSGGSSSPASNMEELFTT